MSDTYWDRLEPHTRLDVLEEGLQARVADPLWMLGRQWQVGEFCGEDASSPVHARVTVEHARWSSYRNEAAPSAAEPFGAEPLEARVEATSIVDGASALRVAADAGMQFLRHLDAAGLGALRARCREVFPLEISEATLTGLPEGQVRALRLLARRALDGRRLEDATPEALHAIARDPSEASTLRAAFQRWRDETRRRFIEPRGSADTWVDERLEHSFSVAAQAREGDVVLLAREYSGGHLDWSSFDVAGAGFRPHGLAARRPRKIDLSLIPAPLAYAGMPSSRWWELEEGTVDFGGITAGPADLGRLAVAEYATVYSDDWFVLPVRLDVGVIARVTKLEIVDSFGDVHLVRSTAALDAQDRPHGRNWRFWELHGDTSAEKGETPWLVIPPSLPASLESEPLERVTFVRDEAANLAWAIESVIESPTGDPLGRRLLWGITRTESEASPPLEWTYRLQHEVPPWWIPFIPEAVTAGSAEVRLRRSRLLAWEDLQTRFVGPQGRVLAPWRPLRLFEEEIPSSGLEVTRRWQMARGADGSVALWMTRQKRPGRHERGSGLRFDLLR